MPYELSSRLRTTKYTPLHLAIFVSIVIHALVLWQFRFSLIDRIKSLSPFVITLADAPSSQLETSSTPDRSARGRPAPSIPSRKIIAPPGGNPAKPATESASSKQGESSGGAAAGSTGLEGAVTDPGGLGIGGSRQGSVGSVPGGRTSSGTGSGTGSRAGTGGAPAGGGKGSKGAGTSAREASVITIPPSIQRITSPYESEIYVEVDHYILYEDNSTVGISVPGDEICLAGDRLRTIDPWGFHETKTDESKCRWLDYGEKDEFKCSRDAYRVITINSYLSSPVNYTANICLAYDKSSCTWRGAGDAPEREICKVRGSYKGIWAESTQFYYRCAKSTIQSYTHPLQYQVRFVQDVEFPGEGLSKRIVQIEMRPIPRCD